MRLGKITTKELATKLKVHKAFGNLADPEARKQLSKINSSQEASNETWKTQDGRILLISEMDDKHLINTIKMLERNAGGSGALVKQAFSSKTNKSYQAMLVEKRKRNL